MTSYRYYVTQDSPIYRKINGSKFDRIRILAETTVSVIEIVSGWLHFSLPEIAPEPDRQWLAPGRWNVVAIEPPDPTEDPPVPTTPMKDYIIISTFYKDSTLPPGHETFVPLITGEE